jgi:hypothetical protein
MNTNGHGTGYSGKIDASKEYNHIIQEKMY